MIYVLKFLSVIKRNKIVSKMLFVFLGIFLISIKLTLPVKANVSTYLPDYKVSTKRYERNPDKPIIVEFANITGLKEKAAQNNMNYILEKEAFQIARSFFNSDQRKNKSILNAINKVLRQDIYVGYEILYQDKNLLSLKCYGESSIYSENDEVILDARECTYIVFDVKAGRKLRLSEFITLDDRIINYKADNYMQPDYDSAAMTLYYSFKDAFGVYESNKYEHHNIMDEEEALEQLNNGRIKWSIEKDKTLLLISYNRDDSWIKIPYSCIKDIAKY